MDLAAASGKGSNTQPVACRPPARSYKRIIVPPLPLLFRGVDLSQSFIHPRAASHGKKPYDFGPGTAYVVVSNGRGKTRPFRDVAAARQRRVSIGSLMVPFAGHPDGICHHSFFYWGIRSSVDGVTFFVYLLSIVQIQSDCFRPWQTSPRVDRPRVLECDCSCVLKLAPSPLPAVRHCAFVNAASSWLPFC